MSDAGGAGSGGSMDGGGQSNPEKPIDLWAVIIEDTKRKLMEQFSQNEDTEAAKTLEENRSLMEQVRNLEAKVGGVSLENGELERKLSEERDKVKAMKNVCRVAAGQLIHVHRAVAQSVAVLLRFAGGGEEGTAGGPSNHVPANNVTLAAREVPDVAGNEVTVADAEDQVMASAGDDVPATAGNEDSATTESEVPATTESEVPATTANEIPMAIETEVPFMTIKTEIPEDMDAEEQLNGAPPPAIPSTSNRTTATFGIGDNITAAVTLGTIKEEGCTNGGCSSPPPPSKSQIDFMKQLSLQVRTGQIIRKYSNIRWIKRDRARFGLRPIPQVRQYRPTTPRPVNKPNKESQPPPKKKCRIARHAKKDEEVLLYHRVDEAMAASGCYCSCGLSFSAKVCLNRHIRYYNEDWKFRCSDCKKSYFSTHYLRVHMERVHLKPLVCAAGCSKCGEIFTTHKDAFRHRKSCSSN